LPRCASSQWRPTAPLPLARHRRPIRSFKFNDAEALRILSKGSQTVAPPSRLPTGHPYAWVAGRGPQDIQAAECPAWLLAQLQAPPQEDQEKIPVPALPAISDVSTSTRARAYLLKCEPCNPLPDHPMDASTHHLKIATALVVGFALPLETAVGLIREWDQAGNPSPWAESEIRRKCQEAVAHSTKPLGYLLQQPDPKPIKMNTSNNNAASTGTQAVARRFRDIEAKAMEWLWPGWLPLGKLAVLDGDPGLGKSTMLLDLAARISNHGLMPDGKIGIAGAVIVMSAEDAADDTIRPRLEAAGANLDRVIDLSHVIVNGEERPIEVPKDLPLIASKIKEHKARLLIVDPLMAFLCGADANKDQEIRRVLYKFSKISEKYRCATIAMRHLNKSGTGKAIYRGNSSIGVIGHSRTGLIVAVDPVGDVCRVDWCGTSPYTADELVSQRSEEEKATQQAAQSKVQQAVAILELLLQENSGQIEIRPAKSELSAAGLSGSTIDRAVKTLGLTVQYLTEADGSRRYFWLSHTQATVT
jgi:archaellum biogenesis ATPase FlaH